MSAPDAPATPDANKNISPWLQARLEAAANGKLGAHIRKEERDRKRQ